MTKLHDEVNPKIAYGIKATFSYGKAKVAEGANLWAGKWKRINEVDGKHFELEGRGFNLDEIDEVKFSREGMIKILEKATKDNEPRRSN